MKPFWPLSVAFACLHLGLAAQQIAIGTEPALSGEQEEGRRIFQQKCAVCHLSSGREPYARRLSSARVQADEEYVRQAIATGRGARMPGWRYTLRPDQIDALIAYLKTLDSPSPTVTGQVPKR